MFQANLKRHLQNQLLSPINNNKAGRLNLEDSNTYINTKNMTYWYIESNYAIWWLDSDAPITAEWNPSSDSH